MTPTSPPTGPGPASPTEIEATARQLTNELVLVSKDLLTQSANPKLPQLSQLLMRRGKLLEELGRLRTDAIPEASRATLRETLVQCQNMDETIAVNLASHRNELGDQLRSLKDTHALLDKYRAGAREGQGSITEEA